MANYPYFPNWYFPNQAAATGPTAAEIATAVWGKELPGAFASGTAGFIVGKILKFVKYIVGAL